MRSLDNLCAAKFIATVGGLGQVAWPPGTWGSAVGLLLGVLGARTMSQPLSVAVLVVTFVLCAVIAGRAERALGQHDPPAGIVDEVWAMCAIMLLWPAAASSWMWGVAAFLLFRIFDILKPQPLQRLATLPGGWGIMADDLGAAVYTILVLWLLQALIQTH